MLIPLIPIKSCVYTFPILEQLKQKFNHDICHIKVTGLDPYPFPFHNQNA